MARTAIVKFLNKGDVDGCLNDLIVPQEIDEAIETAFILKEHSEKEHMKFGGEGELFFIGTPGGVEVDPQKINCSHCSDRLNRELASKA